jgi:hypothetical protein
MISFVDLAKTVGFTKVEDDDDDDDDDDVDLPESHTQSLNNEELAELDLLTLEESRPDDHEDDDKGKIHKERGLTLNYLREISETGDIIVDYVKKNNHFMTEQQSLSEKKIHASILQATLNEKLCGRRKEPLIPSLKSQQK